MTCAWDSEINRPAIILRKSRPCFLLYASRISAVGGVCPIVTSFRYTVEGGSSESETWSGISPQWARCGDKIIGSELLSNIKMTDCRGHFEVYGFWLWGHPGQQRAGNRWPRRSAQLQIIGCSFNLTSHGTRPVLILSGSFTRLELIVEWQKLDSLITIDICVWVEETSFRIQKKMLIFKSKRLCW